MSEEFVYHGSKISGLKKLVSKEAGYGKSYVYATTSLPMAAVFITDKGRNSFIATWDVDKKGKAYFCERKKDIIDQWYKGKSGTIYLLSKKNFYYKEPMSEHERVCEKSVKVVKEIKIKDMKKYLFKLAKEGKIEITLYKDRKKKFPNDNDIVKNALIAAKKYGYDPILKAIKRHQPKLEKKFKKEAKNL